MTEFSAKENEEADDEVPTPTELTDDNEVLWKVHKILDSHVHKGKVTFKVFLTIILRYHSENDQSILSFSLLSFLLLLFIINIFPSIEDVPYPMEGYLGVGQ